MKVEVTRRSYEELPEYFKDEFQYTKWDRDYLCIEEDGKVARVYSSCMEPEDVMFCRDLSWIVDEINGAYREGLEEGKSFIKENL